LTAADGSFQDISLEVRAGEVLGLYGLIGAGRTEWAQALFGLRPVSSGEVLLDGEPWQPHGPGPAARAGVAYLPEDRLRLGLCPELSVRANAVLAALRRLAAGPFVLTRRENATAREVVEQLKVRLHSLAQPAATLSGGNQQKVVLGRWLACGPRLLILDEPTRGIDVGARGEIHALLRRLADAGLGVILISSDLPEVLGYSDRIGVFRSGRLAATFPASEASAEGVATLALPPGGAEAAAPDPAVPRRQPAARRAAPSTGSRLFGLLGAVLVLAAVLTWRTDTFLQPLTLRDLGENAALLALCGLGSALVILAGGIDISLGAIMALSAATAGHLMRENWPPEVAVPLALGAGALMGALNAGLSLLGRVHPIVVTLGTLSLYRGLTLVLIGGRAIHEIPHSFRVPWQAAPLGVPGTVWLALALVVLAWLFLEYMVPGREVMALGSNPRAARRSGIHPARVWLLVFSLQGFLAALAGLSALATAGHLQATDFEEKTLEAIGVAVIGGIAVTGGRGSVWGMCAAALLFRVLEKGWVLLHISGYWQRTIVGGLLLAAILADRLWQRSAER
jgi:ribose/xylose/arabinose/galactoside ABC-type transport system permease subunit/ABC-type multidrug transport system ATPase subunit